jgi:predicted nucleotidyltransferase
VHKVVNELIQAELDKYIQFISSLSGVLQIYLFGSYAHGEQRKTSDIDLMVIIENDLDPFNIAYRIRKGLTETDYALDIAVNRRSDFEEASEKSSFQKSIKENGLLLYVA